MGEQHKLQDAWKKVSQTASGVRPQSAPVAQMILYLKKPS